MPRKTAKTMGAGSGQEFDRANGNGSSSHEQSEQIGTDEIAARAYEIYEREGRTEGRDLDHWLRAESELRSERANGGRAQENMPRSARLRQEDQGRPTPVSAS